MTDRVDRSQLQQIIAGIDEGVMLIETNQDITYVNAAALSMHGVKDLAELGTTVDAYRKNFVLRYRNNHPVRSGSYPIERVLAGEALDDVIVQVARRNNRDRDWAHRIRSLVITKSSGLPDFLVLLITDVSELFEAEDRFERTFAANPAPSLICRLADQRFIKLNAGFLELTGYDRTDVLGHTLTEIDVLHRADRRDHALDQLRAGQTIPQMQACLQVPKDREKLVIVAGQPLEVDDDPCMLFTFADLEPRRAAEAALRESEERFMKCFRLAPIPMALATADAYRFVDVNEAFCTAIGYSGDEILGRTAGDIHLWLDDEARVSFERDLVKRSSVHNVEARLRSKDGEELACLIAAEVLTINNQQNVLCAFQDISDRKRNEAELVAAIEAVMTDASWFSQAVVERLAAIRAPVRAGKSFVSGAFADLTARERQIMGFICRGLNDAAISQELNLSVNTVRNHVASLYRKIGVNRRSAVIVWARERGLADEPPRRSEKQAKNKA